MSKDKSPCPQELIDKIVKRVEDKLKVDTFLRQLKDIEEGKTYDKGIVEGRKEVLEEEITWLQSNEVKNNICSEFSSPDECPICLRIKKLKAKLSKLHSSSECLGVEKPFETTDKETTNKGNGVRYPLPKNSRKGICPLQSDKKEVKGREGKTK